MVKSAGFKKPITKKKIIIYSVIGFIFLAALGNFIATCGFSFDNLVSTELYKGTNNDFVRGGTAGTVLDGGISFIPLIVIAVVICLLNGGKGIQVNKPKAGLAKQGRIHYIVYIVGGLVFFGLSFYIDGYAILADQGFGGIGQMSVEFIFGIKFLVPCFVISMAFQSVMYGLLAGFTEGKIVSSNDFLERNLGKPMLILIVTFIYLRIVGAIFKDGMGRPYGYDIHFTDTRKDNGIYGPLEKIHDGYPKQYDAYLTQKEFNGGGGGPTADKTAPGMGPTDQPGGKPARGYFNPAPKSERYKGPDQTAFPSGHMVDAIMMCPGFLVLFYNHKGNKKGTIVKNVIAALLFVYMFDMILALLVSTSHGGSDITFTMVIAVPLYYAGYGTIVGIENSIKKSGTKRK